MKRLISLCVAAVMALPLLADPNWKIHPTFNETITRIIDTPDYTYFACRTQPLSSASFASNEYLALFRYDKDADELLGLSRDNLLSSNVVSKVEYSPKKKFMVVIYTNYDIDLIYDNGKVVNIPSYRLASLTYSKKVNSIFIDPERDRVYLSTDFGYVALNDVKGEIAESRLYGVPVQAMTRVGDKLCLMANDKLLTAPEAASRLNMSDYKEVTDAPDAAGMTWLGDSLSLMTTGNTTKTVYKLTPNDDDVNVVKFTSNTLVNTEPNSLGAMFRTRVYIFQMYPDGTFDQIQTDDIDDWLPVGSYDLNEVWFGKIRSGFTSKRYSKDTKSWTVTRDYMSPDAPATFMATDMVWHSDYGLLVANHGYDRNFMPSYSAPVVLSGYRDGFWSNYSPTHTAPDNPVRLNSPNGLAIDPDNPDYVYFGSVFNGLVRINTKDGDDILQMSRTSDPYKHLPGFVEVVTDQESWHSACSFGAPKFDYYGNLWTVWGDVDGNKPRLKSELFVWTAADRRASTSAETYRPMTKITVSGIEATHTGIVQPLLRSGQRDIVLYTNGDYSGQVAVVNTNGTPSDPEDDTVVNMSSFKNQDGDAVNVVYIHCMYEDPDTGTVWVGHDNGVFTFNPTNAVNGENQVNVVKVARNDGTNLADYLLHLVKVNRIVTDGQGRKWFATKGAGAVCTSSDGRTVYQTLTTSNSEMPSDNVFGIGYVRNSNSMMFSTESGMAEYYMSGGATASGDMDAVRIYPNPVRPDYYGYVTVDGLPDGALVKVVDSGGNMVKELGIASGGEVKWDVTNTSFKRVSSGVYFVLSSTDENGGNLSNVGKVLVIN